MALLQTKARPFDIRETMGALIGNVRAQWIAAIEVELKPLDLTAAQYIVILKVGSGTAASPMELCKTLEYDTGAMTRLIDRIEAKGLIRRVAHEADRRSVVLELTPAGNDLYPRLLQIVLEMHKRALKGFSRDEAALLESMLKRVAANVGGRA